LPQPPEPVSVSRRVVPKRRSTSLISCSRPMNVLSWTLRFCRRRGGSGIALLSRRADRVGSLLARSFAPRFFGRRVTAQPLMRDSRYRFGGGVRRAVDANLRLVVTARPDDVLRVPQGDVILRRPLGRVGHRPYRCFGPGVPPPPAERRRMGSDGGA